MPGSRFTSEHSEPPSGCIFPDFSWPQQSLKMTLMLSWNESVSLSRARLFATPTDLTALQASLSMPFSRQEYWSVEPFPSPGDLPNPGIEHRYPALQADSSPSESPAGLQLVLSNLSCLWIVLSLPQSSSAVGDRSSQALNTRVQPPSTAPRVPPGFPQSLFTWIAICLPLMFNTFLEWRPRWKWAAPVCLPSCQEQELTWFLKLYF